MRYDCPVFFQRVSEGKYDANTGNYGPDEVVEDKIMASVVSCSADTLRLIYGEIKQGAIAIHLQNHYNVPFDRIRIGHKVYTVDFQRKLRVKHSFIASEVQ